MPSQRVDKLILAGAVFAFGIVVLFFSYIVTNLSVWLPDLAEKIVEGAAGTLLTIAAHRVYKIIYEGNDIKTKLFQRDIMDGIGDVKRNVGEVDCKISKMDCRVERMEQTIDKMNVYSDVKKRRWSEFDSDWVAVRKNFEKLNNNDIYAFGRIIKDTMREYAHEVTLSDLTGDPKAIQDFMAERGRAYTEDLYHRAKQMLPPHFVEYFRMENTDNRDIFRVAVHDLLNKDKINNRAEKIHLLARQYLGRSHNTLYLSWIEWARTHREQLAVDPVERYFKKPVDDNKEDAPFQKRELAHQ